MKEEGKRIRASAELTDYRNLMQRRIHRVLLVCSSYDAYILEEDGRIESNINQEYHDLGLTRPPSFVRVSASAAALERLGSDPDIDLIISMYNVGEDDVFTVARQAKALRPEVPFVLLTHFTRDVFRRIESADRSAIDHVFCWHGSADLILAIVKLIEDRMNADNDILGTGVQCILLVEDSVRFYSSYLPAIYKLVMQQSREFNKEALNERQLTLRKRSRPKILLATNYRDAVALYEKYRTHMLGVISDVAFGLVPDATRDEEKQDAGIDLCRMVREADPLMPFILQSSQQAMRQTAEALGVGFLEKYSKNLLEELGEHIRREFLFGDFVFRDPDTGAEIGRARDLRQLQQQLAAIPERELLSHTSRNHLSKWMYARGLFSIAGMMRALTMDDFPDVPSMRAFLVEKIRDYRMLLAQGVVAHFDENTYNESIWVARIGEGSLGGKGRGLGFMNSMLRRYDLYDKYRGVRVMLPRTVVVATDWFDEFIALNDLHYVVGADLSDEEILSEFVSARLPEKLLEKLRVFIRYASGPLAVRSSSKLEDSHYQPFAGIYSTYMLPLADNPGQTLRMLAKAVKSVYASVYFAASRQYINASANVLSEEKMAVVIQEVCGTADEGCFFPTLSGVARSLNFYPLGHERPEDGVAEIGLGLGKLVVEGGKSLRFSPRHPKNVLQTSTVELALRDTQKYMYALDLNPGRFLTSVDDSVNLRRIEIGRAQDFRNMRYVASTWDMQNQALSDNPFEKGRKVVTFNNILRHDAFPLAAVLCDLLDMGCREMHTPVEIEFAVNLDVPQGAKRIFNFLQIRPIVDSENPTSLDWSAVDVSDALLWARSAVGMGQVDGVRDVVYVKPQAFDPMRTVEAAAEVAAVNEAVQGEGYVLIGPGRWGSSDHSLGVPVRWADISAARVIAECGLENFRVEPSQGTHFFQNLVSFGVGYLTINPFMGDGGLDIARLDALPAVWEGTFVRHVRFAEPLYIFVDGRNNKAVIK